MFFVACQFLLSFVASRSNNNDTNKYRNNNNICVLSTKRNKNIFDIYLYNSNLKREPFCNDYLQQISMFHHFFVVLLDYGGQSQKYQIENEAFHSTYVTTIFLYKFCYISLKKNKKCSIICTSAIHICCYCVIEMF